ncbi:hypothetical protein ACFSUK_19240 [Sphingobium scionense]
MYRAPQTDEAIMELDDRNQQIVAAAYDLLDEEGLEGLTIRAVLQRTGLARRAFTTASPARTIWSWRSSPIRCAVRRNSLPSRCATCPIRWPASIIS